MLKVLIVDDEYIMRQGLRYMIDWNKEGYEIVGEASNGNDALKLVNELHPDIVISDIVMPVLDGVDFSAAMHHMYPDIQIIILSGYDNFEYVKQTLLSGAVDYILKPTLNPKGLIDVLERASLRISGYAGKKKEDINCYESMLERYLLGADQEIAPLLFDGLQSSYYVLYGFCIHKEKRIFNEIYEMIHDKIERELSEIDHLYRLMVVLRDEQICLLLGYEISQRSILRIKLEKISTQIGAIYTDFFAVLSTPFSDKRDIKNTYNDQIAKNWDKGFYYPDKHFLTIDTIGEERKAKKFDFSFYNRLLLGAQFDKALAMLIEYHEDMLMAKTDTFRMKNQMKNLLYIFLDSMMLSDQEKENYRYDFFGNIDAALYENEYRGALEDIFQKIRNIILNTDGSKDGRIDKILDYIEKNYMENLTMESLADEFNFNYYYLSSYFNQQVKEGFSGYQNKVRVQKACEILENKNIPVSDVSSMVGYSEHSYFCRVFKKMTGKTPSAWRREND